VGENTSDLTYVDDSTPRWASPYGGLFWEITKVSPMQSAQHYRDRAERVRKLAEGVADPDLRRQLHIIAEDYNDLARSAASYSGYGSGTGIAEIEGMNSSGIGFRR
jgi:hypothetical protein